MDRRKFIKQTGTLIAGAALAPYAIPENGVTAEASSKAATRKISMTPALSES
jgi:hypothetical protein